MTSFTTKKVSTYGSDTDPVNGVSNSYPTPKGAIKQPCLLGVFGLRNSGKSYAVSKIVNQAQKQKTFDRIYIITPTFLSNVAYFGKFINEEDIFEPTRDSIKIVVESVEEDVREYEEFVEKLKDWKSFKLKMKSRKDLFSDSEILKFTEYGWFDDDEQVKRPVWKYPIERVPQSLVILDDILGSPVVHSPYFTKVATLNRHIGGLQEPMGDRSAGGLAVIFNSQTYSMAQGVSRVLRENLTAMLIFKNKQEKQLAKMIEELGGVVEEDQFMAAYDFAIRKPHDSLLVSFKTDCATETFKRNLNEMIIFPEAAAECKCNK